MSKPTAFLITPIGDSGTPARERADALVQHVVRPALEADFDILRADWIAAPGSVPLQIIEWLGTADLVIADLTGNNPNVAYELGLRHATGLPTVMIVRDVKTLPFDLASCRAIEIAEPCDPRHAGELRRHVDAAMRTTTAATPVSYIFNVKLERRWRSALRRDLHVFLVRYETKALEDLNALRPLIRRIAIGLVEDIQLDPEAGMLIGIDPPARRTEIRILGARRASKRVYVVYALQRARGLIRPLHFFAAPDESKEDPVRLARVRHPRANWWSPADVAVAA